MLPPLTTGNQFTTNLQLFSHSTLYLKFALRIGNAARRHPSPTQNHQATAPQKQIEAHASSIPKPQLYSPVKELVDRNCAISPETNPANLVSDLGRHCWNLHCLQRVRLSFLLLKLCCAVVNECLDMRQRHSSCKGCHSFFNRLNRHCIQHPGNIPGVVA